MRCNGQNLAAIRSVGRRARARLARHGGDASVRRVYGDFTHPGLAPWKQVSLEHSFRTVNTFSYTTGGGSADAALIIEAMDYLHSNPSIAGFAIVSSDSDFTPLAQRLREAGKSVVGFGERKTPKPFVTACERFVYIENLMMDEDGNGAAEKTSWFAVEDASLVQRPRAAAET